MVDGCIIEVFRFHQSQERDANFVSGLRTG